MVKAILFCLKYSGLYGVLAHPVFYCLVQYVKILMGENLQDSDSE